jgi:glucose/arabinose dehydrogenase
MAMEQLRWIVPLAVGTLAAACSFSAGSGRPADAALETGVAPRLARPEQRLLPELNFATVIDWPAGQTPVAPTGFRVTLYADGLDYPRWLYVLPNGDVLVAEARTEKVAGKLRLARRGLERARYLGPSANRITLLRDADRDGRPEVRDTFLAGLNQPFGMLLLGETLYVANTDGLVRFPYRPGQTRITAPGEKILDLPAGDHNNHWTRNVVARPDGRKLYVSVGSQTNSDEDRLDTRDARRAAILEVDPDGGAMRVFASGLRNPNGMAFYPGTSTLWTVVNERDLLGDAVPPDFLTSVREGAFYGWPYAYFGPNADPSHSGERPDLVARTVVPDYALGAHTASLGLAFYRGAAFPARYRGGAFVGQHGSWNRSTLAGYKVIYIPFADGRPAGPPEDFLTGFVVGGEEPRVYGRPAGVAELPDGALLVADDASNRIWRVDRLASSAGR